jgi:hypothetical protein
MAGVSWHLCVQCNPISQNRRKVRVHKPVSLRYYLPEAMPLVLCGACLTVVLEKSEEARGIYREIVESYRLPDIEAAFKKLRRELPPREVIAMWKENVEALRSRQSENKEEARLLLPDGDFFTRLNDKTSGYSYAFEKWFNLDREEILSPNFRHWWELINSLIRVGFNRKSDRDEGIYKVTGEKSAFLFFAIDMRAFAEHRGVGVVNDDRAKVVRIGETTYDLTTLLAVRPMTRRHRLWTKSYKQAGYRLVHDHKIERSAGWWYESRVVYSSPEQFYKDELFSGQDGPAVHCPPSLLNH